MIAPDPLASRKLYVDTLGLPLEGEGGDYHHSERIAGCKSFGIWPLAQAAEACFGTPHWPAERLVPQVSIEFDVPDAAAVGPAALELEQAGYELLHPPREEPWGQTVARCSHRRGRWSGSPTRLCYATKPEKTKRGRTAAVPYTLRNLKEDLEDLGSNFDGAPDLEFRHASEALGLVNSGLSYQRVPPNYRFPYGHTHRKQEEVYVVVCGSGRMKLDDEVVEVNQWDVVRVPPGTWRGYEAGPQGLEILVFGAPSLGEHPREDVEGKRDWWGD